jgi:hypothetical protein
MAQQAAAGADDVAGAFVKAWLNSGPWAQLLTAVVLWKKLGTPGLPGKGGKGGALGGAASKLTPTPVFVTNWGGMPGGKGGPGDLLKKTGAGAAAARAAAMVGGGAEAGALSIGGGLAAALALIAFKNRKNDFPDWGPGGGSVRRQSERQIPAPGFGGGMPGALNVNVQVDGRTIATARATADARKRARK